MNHQSTQQMISTIERKDRRFRVAQTLFMAFTFIALIIIIGIQQRTLNGIQGTAHTIEATTKEFKTDNTNSLNEVKRRLDCIAVFFNQKDRTLLTIDNIDRCTLNRDGDVQQFFTENPAGQTQTTQMEQSPPKANSTAPSGGSANPQPITPNPTPVIPPVSPQQPPLTIETPIIDIPLCVPLLDLCIR